MMNRGHRQTEMAFALLEQAMDVSQVRYRNGLRPIVFEVDAKPPTIWSFDPRRKGALFARGLVPDAALHLHMLPEHLLALAGRGVDPELMRQIDFVGDLTALAKIADCLQEPKTTISVRL